ncbi:Sorting nexin MVP1 [Grifola frondosa]|uniref:Sorting nexin MVP1 n=1 Tax=Grifola frondosa TaxID=5627 RepID=A0A1C7M9Y7_GRIFR|nr:Sorting nexin MVP1 [Grifola frondosa]
MECRTKSSTSSTSFISSSLIQFQLSDCGCHCPAIYNRAFAAVDSANTGETSVNALSRVLGTSSLPASTIDKIISLVSSRTRVSRLEFFVALALVALAQSGKDPSIERVAALAQQNALPEPTLDLDSLVPSTSTFGQYQSSGDVIHAPAPVRGYSPTTLGMHRSFVECSHQWCTGLPREWWKKQETVYVNILGQQGFILNRYLVYEVATDRGAPVPRRYSEFVFLWEYLVKRYPFRLLPALPPKRIGPDETFLEQRRRGLARFINFVVNHPIIKEDGLLAVFLTEPSLEEWRKHSSVSYEEESASKRVDRIEEMSIPSDLEEKLAVVRNKLGFLIEHWQKICLLAERIVRRREAAAADMSRLTNSVKSLVEVNERCWRGDECELCAGVRQGLVHIASHTQKHADSLEHRSRIMLYSTLEALKSQRDLYIAMRDLLIRHDRLSVDQVDRLKKRVETNSLKLETVRQVQKEGWEHEADKITGNIEKDQATIASLLNRRVFIRACMWHELRVVLHNRENALLTQTVQAFAREEQDFSEGVASNWASLVDAVSGMPFE